MSDEEKKALEGMKSLLSYSIEHEYFSPFLAQEIDDMKILLNLIEKLQKEIDKKNKYIESLENTNMEQDMMITGLKEERRLASEEIAEYINEEKTQEFRERIDYLEDLIDAMQTYTSITVEYLEECIKNDK